MEAILQGLQPAKTKNRSPSNASHAVESFAVHLLTLLLERGVVERDEAAKLIANVKADFAGPYVGEDETVRADELKERLDHLAERFRPTNLN
jgi:hypothetical protein